MTEILVLTDCNGYVRSFGFYVLRECSLLWSIKTVGTGPNEGQKKTPSPRENVISSSWIWGVSERS